MAAVRPIVAGPVDYVAAAAAAVLGQEALVAVTAAIVGVWVWPAIREV